MRISELDPIDKAAIFGRQITTRETVCSECNGTGNGEPYPMQMPFPQNCKKCGGLGVPLER